MYEEEEEEDEQKITINEWRRRRQTKRFVWAGFFQLYTKRKQKQK
jgi:hypothetical protein